MQFKLENVRKEHLLGSVKITSLHNINLEVEKGRFYSIFGPSGSGKSRILYIMGCLDLPSGGEIFYNGKNLTHLDQKDTKELRSHEIGFIPQATNINISTSVYDNVAFVLKIANYKEHIIEERVTYWLQELNLWHKKDLLGMDLKPADVIKIAIAKVMVKEPQVLLIDEPVAHLDLSKKFEVVKLLQNINRKSGTTILMTTKNWEIACQTDVVYLLRGGQITEKQDGKTQIQMAG